MYKTGKKQILQFWVEFFVDSNIQILFQWSQKWAVVYKPWEHQESVAENRFRKDIDSVEFPRVSDRHDAVDMKGRDPQGLITTHSSVRQENPSGIWAA